LVFISGTPIMLAASSSSRIASQARPSRPSRIRSDTKTQSAASRAKTANLYVRSNGPSVSGTPGSSLSGPMPIGSIGVMPLTPLDRLKPLMSSPLRMTCGMISPNPRVTSAR
jgi:hypothetical protein